MADLKNRIAFDSCSFETARPSFFSPLMLSALAPALRRSFVPYALSASVAAAPLWSKCQMGTSSAVAAAGASAAAAASGGAVGGKSNSNPPPDASRGATADLCDVHYTEPVDVLPDPRTQKVQIAEPVFR